MLSYFCTLFTRYINKEIDKIKLRHKKKTQPLKLSTLIMQSLSVLSTSIIRNYLSLTYYCLFKLWVYHSKLRYFVGVCIPYNFRAGNFPLSCFKWLPNYVSWEMKLMNSVGKNCAFFVQLLMWVPQTSMIQFIRNKSWIRIEENHVALSKSKILYNKSKIIMKTPQFWFDWLSIFHSAVGVVWVRVMSLKLCFSIVQGHRGHLGILSSCRFNKSGQEERLCRPSRFPGIA